MVPGAFRQVMPWLSARPERGRTWASTPCGSSMAMPVGTAMRCAGQQFDLLIHRRQQVQAGRARGGVVGQGQVLRMRQAS